MSTTTATMIPAELLDLVTRGIEYRDQDDWLPWAWAVLARAGDIPWHPDEEDLNYASHLVTLASLGHLFELFAEVASGGDADLEPRIHLLAEERPGITEIEIARYAERAGVWDADEPETGAGLVHEAILARTRTVHRRLLQLCGEARLFTSLYVAGGHQRAADLFSWRSFDFLDDEIDDDGDSGDAYDPQDRHDRKDEETGPIGATLAEDAFDAHLSEVMNWDLCATKARAYEWLCGELQLG